MISVLFALIWAFPLACMTDAPSETEAPSGLGVSSATEVPASSLGIESTANKPAASIADPAPASRGLHSSESSEYAEVISSATKIRNHAYLADKELNEMLNKISPSRRRTTKKPRRKQKKKLPKKKKGESNKDKDGISKEPHVDDDGKESVEVSTNASDNKPKAKLQLVEMNGDHAHVMLEIPTSTQATIEIGPILVESTSAKSGEVTERPMEMNAPDKPLTSTTQGIIDLIITEATSDNPSGTNAILTDSGLAKLQDEVIAGSDLVKAGSGNPSNLAQPEWRLETPKVEVTTTTKVIEAIPDKKGVVIPNPGDYDYDIANKPPNPIEAASSVKLKDEVIDIVSFNIDEAKPKTEEPSTQIQIESTSTKPEEAIILTVAVKETETKIALSQPSPIQAESIPSIPEGGVIIVPLVVETTEGHNLEDLEDELFKEPHTSKVENEQAYHEQINFTSIDATGEHNLPMHEVVILFKQNPVDNDMEDAPLKIEKPADCSSFSDFASGVKQTWIELKKAKGFKKGVEVVTTAISKGVKNLGQCVSSVVRRVRSSLSSHKNNSNQNKYPNMTLADDGDTAMYGTAKRNANNDEAEAESVIKVGGN